MRHGHGSYHPATWSQRAWSPGGRRRPGAAAGARTGAGLRHLRLGPARPHARRRTGRRAGRDRLRRPDAHRPEGGAGSRGGRPGAGARPEDARQDRRRHPGGYAERLLSEQSMCFPLPNGLAPELDVLTEPLAIAHHAVRRAEVARKDVAIAPGCGPVGLAVIAMLKAQGAHHRRQRLLAWTASSGDRVRGHRRRRPGRPVAVGVLRRRRAPAHLARPRSSSRSARSRSWTGCRCRATTCGGLRRSWRRQPQATGDLRVRRRAWNDPERLDQRAAVLAHHRCEGVHAARRVPAGDGDHQGARAALRAGLYAAGVPRHPAPHRRGHRRRSATRSSTPRSSSIRRAGRRRRCAARR